MSSWTNKAGAVGVATCRYDVNALGMCTGPYGDQCTFSHAAVETNQTSGQCRYGVNALGVCTGPYGDQCTFSHAAGDSKQTSGQCRYGVNALGVCTGPYGDQCTFSHAAIETKQTSGQCRYGVNALGVCTGPYGDQCKFSHAAAGEQSEDQTNLLDCEGSTQELQLQVLSHFSVMSWNVEGHKSGRDYSRLEQCLQYMLPDDDPERWPDVLIILELQRCKRQKDHGNCPFCAQGTCESEHAGWVDERLKQKGYKGEYHQGKMTNTVGLWFQPRVFKLLAANKMRFVDFSYEGSHKGAVLAMLQHRDTGQQMVVAAIHLSVPNQLGELTSTIPLGELRLLWAKIEDIFKWNGETPLILAGDFNSVNQEDDDLPGLKASPDVYNQLTAPLEVDGWGLESAYKLLNGHEPRFTNWKPKGVQLDEAEFVACLDYVFVSPDAWFEPSSVSELPEELPDASFPSDHLPLHVIFQSLQTQNSIQ